MSSTYLYSEGYLNVSGQQLEIENSVVPSGHKWSRLRAHGSLNQAQNEGVGAITQSLIDYGYLKKTADTPMFNLNGLYMESVDSEWFRVYVLEYAPPSN